MQAVFKTPQTGAVTDLQINGLVGSIDEIFIQGDSLDPITPIVLKWSMSGVEHAVPIPINNGELITAPGRYFLDKPLMDCTNLPLFISIGAGSVNVRIGLA